MKIGVIDSGSGGLSVIEKLIDYKLEGEYYFLADIKNFPYGEKSNYQLIKTGIKNINYLISQGVKIIIIACNTLSIAIRKIKEIFSIPILLITDYNIKSFLSLEGEKILLATKSTIKSNYYKRKIGDVINVEAGELISSIQNYNKESITRNLDELNSIYNFNNKIVLLGCTHFLKIKDLIAQKFDNTKLLEGVLLMVEELKTIVKPLKKSKIIVFLNTQEEKENYFITEKKILIKKISI